MKLAAKRKAALAALENHARRYKVKIPDRLKQFYEGAFDRYDLMYTSGDVEGWGGGAFQIALTPPTWLNKDDDAINGPGGEWEDAKHWVPLFVTDQALYIVADLRKKTCPIAWYHEETWDDGPSEHARSLDEFLKELTKKPDVDDEKEDGVVTPSDPDQEMAWEEDFADDGPRAFDAVRDDEEDD